MTTINSRWRKGGQRYDSKRTVETAHWVKDPNGGRRFVRKAVAEALFVERVRESHGWKNGAKVRKV